MEAAEVHELPDGAIDFKQRWNLADIREQALIALFGRPTLLNTAPGGVRQYHKLHEIDEQDFVGLQTATMQRINLLAKSMVNTDTIDRYAQAGQEYANTHQATTNTTRSPTSNALRDVIREQAIPAVVKKFAIMVTTDSDLPLSAAQESVTFYNSKSSSGALVVELFDMLAAREAGSLAAPQPCVRTMCSKHQLSFVDLYPWCRRDRSDFGWVVCNLRTYLRAAILLSF